MKPEVQLVYDGDDFVIPEPCGTPSPGQMAGTVAENLAELAGRECYDSLGRGRDTPAYHEHIREVGHFSVYEHFNFTLRIPNAATDHLALLDLLNRPGLYVRVGDCWDDISPALRVTMNLRCLLDWHKFRPPHREASPAPADLLMAAHRLAPLVIPDPGVTDADLDVVPPADDEERWITLRMTGSRGFSHELVRHGDRTAISQRSTRYVDESSSDWCVHPLVHAAFDEDDVARAGAFIAASRDLYDHTVKKCEPYLLARGVDKGTARKQSRGAARGWLGNALSTSLIFSASVAQWRWILGLRAHPAADVEIRESAAAVLKVLKTTRYADRFADMILVPSPDGLGEVLANAEA